MFVNTPDSLETLARRKMGRCIAKLPMLDLPPELETHVAALMANWKGWQALVIKEQEESLCRMKNCIE